jgi:hypothetical protein
MPECPALPDYSSAGQSARWAQAMVIPGADGIGVQIVAHHLPTAGRAHHFLTDFALPHMLPAPGNFWTGQRLV